MLPALSVLLFALAAQTSAAPMALELRWELVEDVFAGRGPGLSRVAFTLTNGDSKPLPAGAWAVYFSALHEPQAGSVGGGFAIEQVIGDLHRLVPGDGFAGLPPGASVRIEYLTWLLVNRSFAPKGPYVVFDDAKDVGYPLEYVALPFDRSPRDDGRGPRLVTPPDQFALDAVVRDIPEGELPPVFPTPVEVTRGTGELHLAAMPGIEAPETLSREAAFAEELLRPFFGRSRAGGGPPVRLETGAVPGQASPEAYELVVDPAAGIRIVGVSPAGVFYGLQSLRTLLPPELPDGGLVLPAIRVVDAPRFSYRGFMLDVARNFQPKEAVLRTLDLLARYKLNVFHFHLTEDEGWRLEIPSLPELTTVGARRGHTLDSSRFLPPAYGSGPEVDRPWGSGFYSRADYVEILRYAAARHIEVIPELEMPGHARAAIKAMEARSRDREKAGDAEGARQYLLSDPDDRSVYTSAQGYHDNVMNPALESTYAFIERVVSDLVEIHREAGVPLRNLHVGGDEVPAGVWEGSPVVQAYLEEHGLASVDELWFVFYARVARILKAHGLTPSGWEEIAVRKTRVEGHGTLIPNPDLAGRGWRAYVWNNVPGGGAEDLAYRLANGGFEVVLCPASNLYFDFAWNPNPEERGLDWGGYVDLRKPFQFVPFDYYRNVRLDERGRPLDPSVFVGKDRLTDYGKAHVVGIQGNLWSETLGAEGRLEYQMLPKLLGLAERAWAPVPEWVLETDPSRSEGLYVEDWSRFVNVLGKRELRRLDHEVPGIGYRIPTPGLRVEGGVVLSSVELPGFTLRCTTDGGEPTARSPEVRGPIPLRGTIRVAAFDTTGRKGHTASLTEPPRGPYFGEPPPDREPRVLAPGFISKPGRMERTIAFSPDGTEAFFVVTTPDYRPTLLHTRQEGGRWTTPEVASFAREGNNTEPAFSADGTRLYFASNRPPGAPPYQADLWVVERHARGWGEPRRLPPPISSPQSDYHPTVSASGTLCFASTRSGNPDLFCARWEHDHFAAPEAIAALNTEHQEWDPFLAPDESYLIFKSDRPGGLGGLDGYIAFRSLAGGWGPARLIPPPVSTSGGDDVGDISPDGRFLLFSRREGQEMDIYWVDSKVALELEGEPHHDPAGQGP
jgi:hexosaminidase